MGAGIAWRCTLVPALLSFQVLPAAAQYPGYEEKKAANIVQRPSIGLNLRDQYASRYAGVPTWQHSLSNESERPNQNYLQAQPFLVYNLAQGWYFRSSLNLSLETKRDSYYAPVSLGKVFKSGGITYNMYAEPQWASMPTGSDESRLQLFLGLSLRLPH
jgi:hypothetical protein